MSLITAAALSPTVGAQGLIGGIVGGVYSARRGFWAPHQVSVCAFSALTPCKIQALLVSEIAAARGSRSTHRFT